MQTVVSVKKPTGSGMGILQLTQEGSQISRWFSAGGFDPGGGAAISRWLSAAIPPDTIAPHRIDPGGVAAARRRCEPSGVGDPRDRDTFPGCARRASRP